MIDYTDKKEVVDKLISYVQEKPQWISTKDRLPDFEGCLLCMVNSIAVPYLRMQVILYYDYDERNFMDDSNNVVDIGRITHWMPLPEPPEGGKLMYDKLIEDLRRHHCDAKEDDTQEVCEECAYDVIIADKNAPSGIASVCVCGLMHRAADAIEELSKKRVGTWRRFKATQRSYSFVCNSCGFMYPYLTRCCPNCGVEYIDEEPPKDGES